MQTVKPNEKRRALFRCPVRVPATLQFHAPDASSEPVLGVVLDLTERGAMISAELPSPLRLELCKPETDCQIDFSGIPMLPITLLARCIWNQPIDRGNCTIYHIGLCFGEIHASHLHLLRQFIDMRNERNPS